MCVDEQAGPSEPYVLVTKTSFVSFGDDHVLNTFYLGPSSSRLDDVEWFTGVCAILLLGNFDDNFLALT